MKKEYDYLIVGAGLFGAVYAYEVAKRGKKCLVIDKKRHIAGNVYTKEQEGIQVHKYGAHIFHTNRKEAWDYVNQFGEFNRYTNSPIAIYKGEVYNLPFNMNTFHQLWGVTKPAQARAIIEEQRVAAQTKEPSNLEEQALQLAGKDVYEKLIKGYTQKQWGKPPAELPAFIIKRLPFRFCYDNNYFSDRYQGIPIDGYTALVEGLLKGIEVRLGTDFFAQQQELTTCAEKIVYTGMPDQFYDYCYGELEYRSLYFEEELVDTDNYQGNAVVNYTEYEVPYTRIIEHKHFEFGTQEKTIITREYPKNWERGMEPYYPVNDDKNNGLFAKYQERMKQESQVIFGGRLGQYRYYNMDQVIEQALETVEMELGLEKGSVYSCR